MSVTAPPGRTHLYYTGTPEFAFGTGLSYSSWSLEVTTSDSQLESNRGSATFSVNLKNNGPLAGQQRVLAFARPKSATRSQTTPRQRLWGYMGADVKVGDSSTLTFQL